MEIHSGDYFLKMIQRLRQHEEIMLYGNILQISVEEEDRVSDFLETEYNQELHEYPKTAPEFNSNAAIWAAKIVYLTSQLVLYRENKQAELQVLLPDYKYDVNPSAIMSADLCLRFVPNIIHQLKLIDSEDLLISVLEDKLTKWHYSGVSYLLDISQFDFTFVKSNSSLFQLYSDRIIEYKNLRLAQHPLFQQYISAQLSIYGADYWNEFKVLTSSP
jgi:hypothetical protein